MTTFGKDKFSVCNYHILIITDWQIIAERDKVMCHIAALSDEQLCCNIKCVICSKISGDLNKAEVKRKSLQGDIDLTFRKMKNFRIAFLLRLCDIGNFNIDNDISKYVLIYRYRYFPSKFDIPIFLKIYRYLSYMPIFLAIFHVFLNRS
jgi:hypothetical protein